MKKRFLAMLLALSMVGVGCKSASPEETPVETEEEEVVQVEEEETPQAQGNLLENGDFTSGLSQWDTYCFDGECGLLVNKDGALDCGINSVGSVDYGVQLFHDGFALDEGCVYKLTFDAYSDVARPIQMRFQINGGDYHAYYEEVVDLTTENQSYEYTFTMNEASDPAPRFCLNMGVMGDMGEDFPAHHVIFDNFELTLVDGSNKIESTSEVTIPDIAVNQIGYLPNQLKTATIKGTGLEQTTKLIDEKSGKAVYEEAIGKGEKNADTGDREAVFDFSSIKNEGTYHVESGDAVSPSFVISKNVYDDALAAAVKMLHYQRCGCELTKDEAGDFAHPVCHNSKAILYEDNSKKLDVTGGWHDAGDYGRYSVAGAVTAADLLLAYENYRDVFDKKNMPDVLEEAKYELDWLLKMQRADGGVYHKVTCRNFPGEVMPQDETDELVIMPVSTTATGDFAAVMAIAARVYEKTDKTYSKKCLDAAIKAASYLDETPHDSTGYRNPSDITTGEYEDTCDVDERFWAYAELYKTTGDKSYEENMVSELPNNGYTLGWQGVAGYGAYAYLTSKNASLLPDVKKEAAATAKEIRGFAHSNAYGSSIITNYPWGSNLTIANNGEYLLMMKDALGEYDKETVDKQMNYLFGNNATGYCFMTGFGTLYTDHPHHRPSQVMGKTVPGMIAGGPNNGLNDPYAANVLRGVPAAKCYVDNAQSYSTNEIAIYWNSPVIYLIAGEIAENGGGR
ncbi:endoglucanase [Pseudobutyrivibrio sp. OR37]|uniref:glycoside hydrolase family 9 protein n=1 Tax=Pseudobutyrivibrio sp. OR37 TaxID=1798186 RepID=UPI0008E8C5A5|nr:glycoside hydrolase family 9 protein [Pseudobutyrivibrio sp. OR37]SFH57496.1 endoglucanase [Pseudobutyrivibrio sp. OR37]